MREGREVKGKGGDVCERARLRRGGGRPREEKICEKGAGGASEELAGGRARGKGGRGKAKEARAEEGRGGWGDEERRWKKKETYLTYGM